MGVHINKKEGKLDKRCSGCYSNKVSVSKLKRRILRKETRRPILDRRYLTVRFGKT